MPVVNYTPKTWTAVLVTVNDLLNEIKTPWTNIQSAWTAFTPTLTNITLGNGSLSGTAYQQIGKTVYGRLVFAAGSTTSYSVGQLLFSMPVAPLATYTGSLNVNIGVGAGFVSPAGTRQPVVVGVNGSSQFQLMTTSGNAIVTNTVPATFGTSGIIGFDFRYEAA